MGEGEQSENPIVLDKEEGKGNCPPTTPLSDLPTEPPPGCSYLVLMTDGLKKCSNLF